MREMPKEIPEKRPEAESKDAQRAAELAAAEREFMASMLKEAKDAQEKTVDRMFADAREYIGAVAAGDMAEGLKPFLEHAAEFADPKTADEAKKALISLE